MSTRPLPPEAQQEIIDLLHEGLTYREIAKRVGYSFGAVSNIADREGLKNRPKLAFSAGYFSNPAASSNPTIPTIPSPHYSAPFSAPFATPPPSSTSDKKTGQFDWREWATWATKGQELKHKASWSQETATFSLGDGTSPIILSCFSDQQIGDWGTDYSLFVKITEEIRDTPNLYMAMLGDETQHAIKLRNVLEVVSGSLIPPEQQEMFIESWLGEIGHKIAFGVWSNHSTERSEKLAGSSVIKNLISRQAVWFNGIGHADVRVGEQVYKVAASHVFRGRSIYSATHGPRRYARHEGQDREIILQGDLHTPEMMTYYEGGQKRTAITCGSIQSNSGYAKRYFSLTTIPAYPCVVLDNLEHRVTPFWTIAEAVEFVASGAARGGLREETEETKETEESEEGHS